MKGFNLSSGGAASGNPGGLPIAGGGNGGGLLSLSAQASNPFPSASAVTKKSSLTIAAPADITIDRNVKKSPLQRLARLAKMAGMLSFLYLKDGVQDPFPA